MTDPGIILFGKKIGLVESSQNISDDNNPKTPSIGEDVNIMVENSQSKKPDKVLACPRCDSMNTKFCYFNNSNVNQPRHFCKSCQRYWTAGGTMRNMPVGAGRRKKKSPYIIAQDVNNHIEFDQNVLSFSRKENHVKVDEDASNGNGFEAFNSQVQWIPGPYNNPWNVNTPMIPVPITIPMYPPPYWNSVSWLPPAGGSMLGKHPINGWSNEEFKKQKSTILTPKTLRIDDPDEAAKSSIWTTLGIKNEDCGRGDLFKGLQSKGSEKANMLHTNTEPNLAMQANPAAFSRSLCFQERA